MIYEIKNKKIHTIINFPNENINENLYENIAFVSYKRT